MVYAYCLNKCVYDSMVTCLSTHSKQTKAVQWCHGCRLLKEINDVVITLCYISDSCGSTCAPVRKCHHQIFTSALTSVTDVSIISLSMFVLFINLLFCQNCSNWSGWKTMTEGETLGHLV